MSKSSSKDAKVTLTPKQPESISLDGKQIENLQAVLINCPHVQTIYVNKSGAYHFAKVDGYTPFDRDAILGLTAEPEIENKVTDTGGDGQGENGGLKF